MKPSHDADADTLDVEGAVVFITIHTTPNSCNSEPEFDLADWPATSEIAKLALAEMKTTHAAQLLPAFDMHGKLILPADYDNALRGSVVQVGFSLNKYSWRTGGTYKDTFVADIAMMRVITPPRPRTRLSALRKRVLPVDKDSPDLRARGKQRVV